MTLVPTGCFAGGSAGRARPLRGPFDDELGLLIGPMESLIRCGLARLRQAVEMFPGAFHRDAQPFYSLYCTAVGGLLGAHGRVPLFSRAARSSVLPKAGQLLGSVGTFWPSSPTSSGATFAPCTADAEIATDSLVEIASSEPKLCRRGSAAAFCSVDQSCLLPSDALRSSLTENSWA